MSPRVSSVWLPLAACSSKVRTRPSTLLVLDRVWSSRPSLALAEVMLRWYCAESAIRCDMSSARAAPTGSSDGWLIRLPVLSCVLRSDRSLCRFIMLPTDCCWIQLVETRMVLTPHRAEQRVENAVGRADDLGRGLVGLLVAHQVGGFLVQVHAGDALL